jgi:two-component sensor histidine kinase
MSPGRDGNVLILAPLGRDGDSLAALLGRQGVTAKAISSLAALVAQLGETTGAVVLTEEALSQAGWGALIAEVEAQPSWSSYPFIMIVGRRRGDPGSNNPIYAKLPPQITNVIVLERPMGSATLLSAVRWALGGRQRQFTTRDHLAELQRNAVQQQLMTRELAHRVKNTISVLQSIVTQTMRPYPATADLRDLLVERFAALARAHDLLLSRDFRSAEFRLLIEAALSVHQARFRLQGPDLLLSPQASLSFALVIHELATNAVKYGALQDGKGEVHIDWAVEGGQLRFRWREVDGPVVEPPKVLGFGSRLIKSTLNGLGKVEFDYDQAGLIVTFSGPLEALRHAVVPDGPPVATPMAVAALP